MKTIHHRSVDHVARDTTQPQTLRPQPAERGPSLIGWITFWLAFLTAITLAIHFLT